MKNFNICENRISERAIRSLLSSSEDFSKMPILVSQELASTNDAAKELARKGLSNPVCIIAEAQTAGRGRLGRSFYSPAGQGLFLTLALPYEESQERLLFTRAAGVAARRAIYKVCGLDVGIKWVNDLIYKGRKVGGILAEAEAENVVIGIGINCFVREFPEELKELAISLSPSGEITFDRNELAAAIIEEVLSMAGNLRDEKIIREYEEASTVLGKCVQLVKMGTKTGVKGIVSGFTESGGLLLKDEGNNVIEVNSGEISIEM